MNPGKKILSLLLKFGVGLACLLIVFYRLKRDFGPEEKELLMQTLYSGTALLSFVICFLLIPVNWGIESFKWQLITTQVERVSFLTANRSIYSGICAGNFAPGRATEFLGKILYFSDENKPRISVLHFLGGMLQMGVTLLAGLLALFSKTKQFPEDQVWIQHTLSVLSFVLLAFFVFAWYKAENVLKLVNRFVYRSAKDLDFHFRLRLREWLRLFFYSIVRFLVFSSQFYILLKLLAPSSSGLALLPGLALYFMITSLLPMLPVFEAAIRAAVALMVLGDSGLHPVALTLATVLLWLMNIVVPSLIGYIFLLQMKFDFKLLYKKPTR